MESDLKQLTLRAAALAARCARRVQPILAQRGHLLEASQKGIALAEEFARGVIREPQVTSAIAFQAELFPRTPVQEPFPRDPRLDLPHAMGAAREAAKAVAGVSVNGSRGVPVPPPSAPGDRHLISHAAKAIEEAALVTAITLEWIPLDEVFRRDYEARYPQQAQETAWAAEAIQTDFKALKGLHPGSGTEVGSVIDPSENGELGALWPTGTPRWFEELRPAVLPTRLALVVPVKAQQTPQEVRQALDGSTNPADVLCLCVGDETVAFPSTPVALDWVKGFWSSVPAGASPSLIVLASTSPAVSAADEQKARSALVYEYGAVVFSRGTEFGGFPDWIQVQSALPTVLAARTVGRTTPVAGTTIGLPPPTARGYGRQPAHVDDYDPVQFEREVKRLNQAEWWELDY